MGYWYWRKLKSAWVIDENTSNKFDLPERGHISGLYLKLQQKNLTGNYALDNSWPFQKTTLRIIGNGSKEIIDLKGRQMEAINWWNSGAMPKNNLWDDINNIQEAYGVLPFGRYLGDPEYGLILERFSAGVEFEDENTISTTYKTDANSKYDIWALMRKDPEGGLFNRGYLKKRQIKDKDCDTETEYDVKLPTDKRLRQIYLFDEPDLSSNLPATTPFTLLQKIWLGILSKEEYILDNLDSGIFARTIHQMYKRKAHTQAMSKLHASNANYIDTMIYERDMTQLTALHTTAHYCIENSATFYERICRAYGFATGGAGASIYCYMNAWGILYHGLIPLLMQDPLSLDEGWLDAAANKDVYVSFTEGSGDGHIYIVLDELERSYP